MTVLFGRAVRVVVDTLELRGLRVAFQVERSTKREPNSAEARIWNLNDEHRAALQHRAIVPVRIEAGYDPPTLSDETASLLAEIGIRGTHVLFAGDLRVASSERSGADWITTITSDDGGKRHKGARIHKAFRPRVRWRQVMHELVAATGLGVGNALRVIDDAVGERETDAAITVAGNPFDELVPMLDGFGLELSIQDGELQVLERDKALAGSAVVLSPETGLIGSPEVGSDGVIKFRALLQPDVFPGRKLKFEANSVTGFARAERVTYVGDTHATDWYVEGEAKQL